MRPRYLIPLVAAACLWSQSSAPVFRTGTKLVEVTVTVLDKKGNGVTGLEASDFTVLDDGKPRQVSFFRFDGGPAAKSASADDPAPPKLPPNTYTNQAEFGAESPRTITALVLDTLNTPPEQSTFARAQMMRYLRELAPRTQVAMFLMGKQLRILHDFTEDASALRARLAKAAAELPVHEVTDYNRSIVEAEAFVDLFAGDPQIQQMMEEMMRQQLEVESMANSAVRRIRMETSLAALEALGKHLAGIPGRKNLVWIGAGFSMVSISGAMGTGVHGGVEDFETKVRATSRRLAQDGIILYIVDSKGLELSPDMGTAARGPTPVRGRGRFEVQMDTESANNDPRPAMELMANITGGRYLHNSNDLTTGFKQTYSDMQGSYTLGFYLSSEPDDKWHKLKVRVKRSGVEVRNREGYLADSTPSQPTAWTADTWRSIFANPIASTVIPLTARMGRTPSGEVALILRVDPNALRFHPDGDNMKCDLEIGIADRAPDGSMHSTRAPFSAVVASAKWEEARQTGLGYQKQWKPADGATTLRIVVHDVRSGQYGSIEVPMASVR